MSEIRNERRLATVYYTWEELDLLAKLVDSEIVGVDQWGTDDGTWAMLNSLRTSLREAQFTIRPDPHPIDWSRR